MKIVKKMSDTRSLETLENKGKLSHSLLGGIPT